MEMWSINQGQYSIARDGVSVDFTQTQTSLKHWISIPEKTHYHLRHQEKHFKTKPQNKRNETPKKKHPTQVPMLFPFDNHWIQPPHPEPTESMRIIHSSKNQNPWCLEVDLHQLPLHHGYWHPRPPEVHGLGGDFDCKISRFFFPLRRSENLQIWNSSMWRNCFISSFYTRRGKFEQLQFNKKCSKNPWTHVPENPNTTRGKSAEDSHSKPPI